MTQQFTDEQCTSIKRAFSRMINGHEQLRGYVASVSCKRVFEVQGNTLPEEVQDEDCLNLVLSQRLTEELTKLVPERFEGMRVVVSLGYELHALPAQTPERQAEEEAYEKAEQTAIESYFRLTAQFDGDARYCHGLVFSTLGMQVPETPETDKQIPCLIVKVDEGTPADLLPKEHEGYRVFTQVSGRFRGLSTPAS